jgi:hypothetical protein
MFGKQLFATATIAAILICAGATSAQQGGVPKPAQPTTHRATHVGRDICITHPNLPQCSR